MKVLIVLMASLGSILVSGIMEPSLLPVDGYPVIHFDDQKE